MDDVSSRVPQLTTFCYCLSLRIGCYIIGWVACINNVWDYLALVVGVIRTPPDTEEGSYPWTLVEFYYDSLLEPMANIIFLIGLYKSKATFLLPLLILYVVNLLDYAVLGLLLLFTQHEFSFLIWMLGSEGEIPEVATILNAIFNSPITYVIFSVCYVYCFLVINSYFNVLRAGRKISILEEA